MAFRIFAQRLNSCLDDTGAPVQARERALLLSKMLDIPKQEAWSYLDGLKLPDDEILKKIAEEFEVDSKWLKGE